MDRIPGLHVPNAADAAELASLREKLKDNARKLAVISDGLAKERAKYRTQYMRYKMRDRRNGNPFDYERERVDARDTFMRVSEKARYLKAKLKADQRTLKKQIAFVASLFVKSPFKR